MTNNNTGAQEKEITQSAVTQVTDYLKALIFSRKLKTGDRIPTEPELSKLVGVGRGSVREAIKRMEALHVLDVRRGDGTYVANMSGTQDLDSLLYKVVLEDISLGEIADYRIQIEISILHLAIQNITKKELQALRENYESFVHYVHAPGKKDPVMLQKLDISFHILLGKAAHNRLLEDIYAFSLQIFSPYMLRNYQAGKIEHDAQSTLDSHRLILEALEQRDTYTAIYAVENAIALWKRWIVKADIDNDD